MSLTVMLTEVLGIIAVNPGAQLPRTPAPAVRLGALPLPGGNAKLSRVGDSANAGGKGVKIAARGSAQNSRNIDRRGEGLENIDCHINLKDLQEY